MLSIRRKKRPATAPSSAPSLRPALSLPDLTTPLLELDASAWPELPSSKSHDASMPLDQILDHSKSEPQHGKATIVRVPNTYAPPLPPTSSGAPSSTPQKEHDPRTPSGARGRAPSLVRDTSGSPQFHRPFTPWQVVPSFGAGAGGAGTTPEHTAGVGMSGTPRAIGSGARSTMISMSERRRRNKALATPLNVLVAGSKDVGKTSFINALVTSLRQHDPLAETEHEHEHDPSSPSLAPADGRNPLSAPSPQPTTRPSVRSITVSDPFHRTALRLIDTPGLRRDEEDSVGLSGVGPVALERERGVTGLVRLVEERLEENLREESKVVRRKSSGEDMVHLIVYILDARDIVNPRTASSAVEWTFQTDPFAAQPRTTVAESCISSSEIDVIERLLKRANVLPVLGRIDGLSASELEAARAASRRDLAKCNLGLFDADEAMSEDEDEGPLTPVSMSSSSNSIFPYALFNPDSTGMTTLSRRFAWGTADVLNPAHSDLDALRNEILLDRTEALREATREVKYENYRTERLLSRQTRQTSPGK